MAEELGRAFKWDINIQPSDNGGAIVKIGCSTLAFDDTKSLCAGLEKYFSDPDGWEKKYNAMDPREAAEDQSPNAEIERVARDPA